MHKDFERHRVSNEQWEQGDRARRAAPEVLVEKFAAIGSAAMTNQQKQVIDIAYRLGADPREVELATQLMRSGRADLIIAVTAQHLSIRAALKVARSNSSRISSQVR
jgi:hypothetical protein